jgi:hypothetical protein
MFSKILELERGSSHTKLRAIAAQIECFFVLYALNEFVYVVADYGVLVPAVS